MDKKKFVLNAYKLTERETTEVQILDYLSTL